MIMAVKDKKTKNRYVNNSPCYNITMCSKDFTSYLSGYLKENERTDVMKYCNFPNISQFLIDLEKCPSHKSQMESSRS